MRLFDTGLLRQRVSLDGQWSLAFDREDNGLKKGWNKKAPRGVSATQVPWSWNCHLLKHHNTGAGWYYREIYVRDASSLRITFGAVSGHSTVFIDGKRAGSHYGSFTDFSVLLSNPSQGRHLLAVRVDSSAESAAALPPAQADWFNYGGILRPVEMEYIDKILIEEPRITYGWKKGKPCDITLEFIIRNLSGDTVNAPADVYFNGDKIVTVPVRLAPHENAHKKIPLKGLSPQIWSLKTPALHFVRIACCGDDLIERVGFRNIRAEGRKILLNGSALPLKGINRHNIHPDFGFAMPPQLILRDIEIIRYMGCNAIRGSHYPNDPVVLDYCDQAGLLFLEELPLWGIPGSGLANRQIQKRALTMLEEMIRRDINHPSIICWGIQNESASDSAAGKRFFSRMAGSARELDPSRLIFFASNRIFKDISLSIADIVALNVYHGWYDGKLEDWGVFLNRCKAWLRKIGQDKKPFIISEFGAGAIFGEKRLDENIKWTEQYQKRYFRETLKHSLKDPDIAGVFIWQYCDIPTSPFSALTRPREYNNKGIVNEYRLPKEAFWAVKEFYSKF